MFLLCTTFSLVAGLYFLRNNIVLSILISLAYLVFVLWRFGKKKFFVFILFFGIGVSLPRIPFPINNGPDYGGIVIDARDNYIIFQSKFERYYVYSSENTFEIGDKLIIEGNSKELKFLSFDSQFNFKTYLNNKGVKKELVANTIDIKWQSIIKTHQFKRSFLSKFDENTATLISAFLFNDKDYSSDLIKKADENEILYLFSLTGTYLNILFAISNYLLLLKFSKKTSKILTFIIFTPLAIFSFTKIGTQRVFLLYLLKILNEFKFKRRKFIHVELVSLLALFFLIIDYNFAYQEAFYIGFLLSAFAPIVLNSVKCLEKKKRFLGSFILFYLLCLPLRLKSSFLKFSILKMFILIPFNFLFIFFTIICLIFPLEIIPQFLTKGLMWILEKMDAINFAIPFSNWGGTFSFFFIGVVLLIIFYLESVRIKHVNIAITCLITMITISIIPLQEPLINAVYFVNVGQGDSIIIKNKMHTVMIDTGGYSTFDMATETLIPFMNKKKITHIDALIITHDDFDHCGAKESLIDNFTVNNVLTSNNQFPYQIGNIKINNLNTYNFDSDNDNSLVLSMNFMNKKFLFTGDASTNVEDKLINYYNLDCDILKVGHHGSKYSTSEKFIKATSPKEAVISVGAKNYYGHPADEVINRLEKYNVKIRRTDLEGTICYYSLTA